MLLVCNSGMRRTDRKPQDEVFRPGNNSPFAEHLTPVCLLCLCQLHYSTVFFDFNRLIFHDLLLFTKHSRSPSPLRRKAAENQGHSIQILHHFFTKPEILCTVIPICTPVFCSSLPEYICSKRKARDHRQHHHHRAGNPQSDRMKCKKRTVKKPSDVYKDTLPCQGGEHKTGSQYPQSDRKLHPKGLFLHTHPSLCFLDYTICFIQIQSDCPLLRPGPLLFFHFML